MLREKLDEASMTASPNPYVFIVGCQRSGTTLLERIVDAHSHLAIIHEASWILKWYRQRIGLTSEGLVRSELVSRLLEYRKFTKKLGLSREEVEGLLQADEPVSYASFMTGVFDLYGRARGKCLVGDKTPRHVQHIRGLHDLWPRARFVHLIRDGRDVCLAMMAWERRRLKRPQTLPTWKDDPVSTTALWWDLNVRQGRDAGKSLGPELYYEMRYESLVSDPEEACAKLCAFLGVPYEAAMLRLHEGRIETKPGASPKRAWQPITQGLRDWRSQMPIEDLERFEAAAGDLLGALGYPRACRRPSSETMQQAARIRAVFENKCTKTKVAGPRIRAASG